jgi:hypothetical protein
MATAARGTDAARTRDIIDALRRLMIRLAAWPASWPSPDPARPQAWEEGYRMPRKLKWRLVALGLLGIALIFAGAALGAEPLALAAG